MSAAPSGTRNEVDTFLAALEHTRKAEIVALRQIILAVDARIGEGIKWNAPGFRTSEWFATFHLRAKDGVQIILHFGARVRDHAIARDAIADPESLLQWLGTDRASVKFRDQRDVEAQRSAFQAIIRQWIEHL